MRFEAVSDKFARAAACSCMCSVRVCASSCALRVVQLMKPALLTREPSTPHAQAPSFFSAPESLPPINALSNVTSVLLLILNSPSPLLAHHLAAAMHPALNSRLSPLQS